MTNLILNTDSYKTSHWLQYPPKTEIVYSYIEPRADSGLKVLNFGLQAFLIEYLTRPIRKEDVDEAQEILTAHGVPFNRLGWMDIVGKHKGYLPIAIEALEEGTMFDSGNAQLQIYNTDPSAFWLPSYLETQLLRSIWYPSTVATISWRAKKIIKRGLDISSDDPEGQIPFKLHDFGARGVSSLESATLGGMAHLVNFMGTDTISGLIGARKYYAEPMAGFSIPASEHSTMTSWNNEKAAYNNMLEVYAKPGKLLACVSDSYDFYNAVDNIWGVELKQKVIESGATLVIRPDSGHPRTVVMYALNSLANTFGYTTNSKGYKVLNHVRLIQGDGIDNAAIEDIVSYMIASGFSVDNIAFGMGGGLLQKLSRDTLNYAMKTNAIQIDGKIYDVSKTPITDSQKNSKKGILSTYQENGKWVTSNDRSKNEMKMIFKNGRILNKTTFSKIRELSNS